MKKNLTKKQVQSIINESMNLIEMTSSDFDMDKIEYEDHRDVAMIKVAIIPNIDSLGKVFMKVVESIDMRIEVYTKHNSCRIGINYQLLSRGSNGNEIAVADFDKKYSKIIAHRMA